MGELEDSVHVGERIGVVEEEREGFLDDREQHGQRRLRLVL